MLRVSSSSREVALLCGAVFSVLGCPFLIYIKH